MNIDRRTFTKSLALAAGALALPSWPINEKQLALVEAMTEGASGPTYLRPDGSPTHW